ncbi:MAG: hypothetical protein KDI14_14235 [Halioglobus sp.]|nr:hypothetical protein [Halioglobus sp.]
MNESVISVASLSTANESDFFSFFDGDAFSDNPEWSSCYCQCFYEDREDDDGSVYVRRSLLQGAS